MKIAIASENKNKIQEFKEILQPLGYELLTPSDLKVDMSAVIEDGETFSDNALIKAQYLFNQTGLSSIADDSGIVIESLPDILGVRSSRFLEGEPYSVKNFEVIKRLKDKSSRNAYFISAIAYVTKENQEIFVGQIDGTITHVPKGDGGFGYDPIFLPVGYEETFAELSAKVKNEISHRAISLKKFVESLHEK